ncbi:alpha-glucosidase [Bdellovibrio bacteriovorus]|uniref:Alpha-amylase n=1 Tax=Bdellovibrio bacteriovorus (strain ATCC 15356 / DSM 50701 / NCIMB 9529 / HD100) TaxID=264462 RepID=Q6MKU9_BDEBA|nr:alpha-glucosidase [Bdellovibrio bacteriovorus]CAE80108.1 alpha-D-1,4-glucosidase [Bdellovibrio bacteriovorus HD100]
MSEVQKNWWKEAVVYQVYPRSFKDSNGDGMGDLQGLISKLDYLKELGINVIWICPMYKSPQDDNGYDISDYQDIHHEFGTMKDFDQLLQQVHARGMKLIIDLVVNHTSDEHPWFIESRSSRNNPKRDWYIWRDGKNGKEPNNWESIFSGSAWKYDELTQQYFMHIFSSKQPDLNWENLDMRKAVYDMINWWLDKGIDGFRVDAISHARKEPGLADMPNPNNLEYVPSYDKHMNVNGIQEYLKDLCTNTFNKYDIMTVAEANGVSAENAEEWVGREQKKFNMIIQFEHVGLWDANPERRVDLAKLKSVLGRWQKGLEGRGWNALFVENHDVPRITSKWGDIQNFWRESTTSIATMYFMMQGTPFIYQGQEIGMTNTVFNGPEDFNDVSAKNIFTIRRKQGATDAEITADLASASRDNARTPMQWDSSEQGGFTTGRPWLKVNPNYKNINVAAQDKDPTSVLNFYRNLIRLRKAHSVFIYGVYDEVLSKHDQIYAYTRTDGNEKMLVMANMTGKPAKFDLPGFSLSSANLLMANYAVADHSSITGGELRPFESRIYKIN